LFKSELRNITLCIILSVHDEIKCHESFFVRCGEVEEEGGRGGGDCGKRKREFRRISVNKHCSFSGSDSDMFFLYLATKNDVIYCYWNFLKTLRSKFSRLYDVLECGCSTENCSAQYY
jgi:hypothetical protein